MNQQKSAKNGKQGRILPIFAALCALFASGAIIGITVLSNPALEWKLITGLLPKYAVCFAVAFLAIYGYGSILPKIAYLTLPVACLACGVRTAYASAPYVSALTIALVFVPLTAASVAASLWALQAQPSPKANARSPQASAALPIAGVCVAAAASLALFAVMWNGRLQSLQADGTPQAQYGQMLYYMQHSGLPFTTLASAQPQSWFLTQFSPLWYAILPAYVLSGHQLLATGMTLYALMLTGLAPLWRICRKNALTPWQTAALCAACAPCPLVLGGGASGGALTMLSLPLILWVADALTGKHPYLALLPLTLCLCIGFEVTVWLPFVCLYLTLTSKQSRRAGWVCTALSAAAMIATTLYLALVNSPALTGLFSGIGLQAGQKLLFLLLLLLPLALLPLLTKQKAALVLLFPFVLFHLVANAAAYSGVFCTYAYPTVAVALLLTAQALGSIPRRIKALTPGKLLPALVLCTAILLATPYVALLDQLYLSSDEQQAADAAQMQELLAKLPQNASVTASDSLLCSLHDRTWLFSLNQNPTQPQSNVIVLDLREDFIPSSMEPYDVAYYQSLGYTLRTDLSANGLLAVLFK